MLKERQSSHCVAAYRVLPAADDDARIRMAEAVCVWARVTSKELLSVSTLFWPGLAYGVGFRSVREGRPAAPTGCGSYRLIGAAYKGHKQDMNLQW